MLSRPHASRYAPKVYSFWLFENFFHIWSFPLENSSCSGLLFEEFKLQQGQTRDKKLKTDIYKSRCCDINKNFSMSQEILALMIPKFSVNTKSTISIQKQLFWTDS